MKGSMQRRYASWFHQNYQQDIIKRAHMKIYSDKNIKIYGYHYFLQKQKRAKVSTNTELR